MFRDKTLYGGLTELCAVLSWLVLRWPFIVLAVSLASPVSPQLRLTSPDSATGCIYSGVHGLLYEYDRARCPLIALINTQGRGQW